MKKYGIIYLITNITNNKLYVGQTTQGIEKRILQHKTEKRNRHISNAIRLHGEENFKIEILCDCFSREELNQKEIDFVKKFNTLHPHGYNHRAGGDQKGLTSEETKKKISKSKIGKKSKRIYTKQDENMRLRISKSLGGKYILATEISTDRKIIYLTAHETSKYGFQPWNVVSVCKGRRPYHKGFKFEYYETQANQSGSSENKKSEHAQRIGTEPNEN